MQLFTVAASLLALLASHTAAFTTCQYHARRSTLLTAEATTVDPKEAVKVFGRLAEKYIALDSSGGSCCYSGCTDCEFRLPGGGYRMAEQRSARPKWIPNYTSRQTTDTNHVSKWSSQLFTEESPSISKADFVAKVMGLDYNPPLGGPYVGASAAEITDTSAVEAFFDSLVDGSSTLSKAKMSRRLKQLADGEEGLTWGAFQSSL